jgi:hypothetical protein
MMKYTRTRLNDPRLPTDGIIQLHDAIEECETPDLIEAMELAIENGYFLVEIDEEGYTLEKSEIVN